MNWRVFLTKHAEKQLKRLPSKELKRISEIINLLSVDSFIGDMVKLEGDGNIWRRRLGNYRVIFELSPKEKVIFVYEIICRASNTY